MRLAKAYNPNDYEPNIYAMWEEAGAFKPTGVGEPFSMVMPPPNANGNLHIGHGFELGLKDVIARYQRMNGKDVAYIPGADHAGFETWVVYERELAKQEKSRFDFSREQLYSQVWDYVDKQRGNMELQIRALGISCSWDDLVFTLDKKVVDTVYSTFKKLWDDGLVYRGERMVNYCVHHKTSFADIEVEHKTEKGKLWKIAYPTLDKVGEIVVATTRPETMFGDTAVAVHPDDERYKHLIGTRVQLPLTGREIPIIADKYVDPKYGTGAVKITPAHDPNDFEIGERHKLERIQVIDFDGKMINVPDNFKGLDTLEARKKVLNSLRSDELIKGEEAVEHSVGHCYKCNTVIEPLVKDQWFLKMQELKEKARIAIEAGEINFTPNSKKRVLLQYLEGLKDWNLSRQIPWGIPIPAFQSVDDPDKWIYDDRVEDKKIVVDGTTYKREEDTFDTWFSSGQWPFIVTDAMTDGKLAKFYPTSLMETGTDLLDRWVARMIMLGVYVTDQIPFKNVYLHGMVLDEKGQKMSKSKGNVINPMETVGEYGSDAFRLGLIANRSAGQNQAYSTSSVIAGRNFCNKLWNVARFAEGKLGDSYRPSPPELSTIADHWVVNELNTASKQVQELIEKYRIAEASDIVYHVIWDSVADWFIEASKQQDNPDLLAWVLDTSLKLAHPFAPFVTETIWQTLAWRGGDNMLIKARWPEELACDDIAAGEFEQLKQLVSEARFVASDLPGNNKYDLLYQNDSLVADNASLIQKLTNLKSVKQTDQPKGLRLPNSGREAWLDVDEKTLYEHRTNLEVRLAEIHKDIASLKGRLDNKSYVEKAPKELVDDTQKQLEQKQDIVKALKAELEVIR